MIQRKLAPRELVPLLAPGEPVLPVEDGGEILGLPISLGIEGRPALLLLYRRAEAFHPSEKEVLQTALSSFGQALTRLRAAIELEKLATRDGLTGLLNHRTFQSSFRRELLKARRTNSKVALLLTDVDFFKKVNDAHGHPAGDAVLRSVATTLGGQLREDVDIVARYGGEEFVCVLVGTTEAGALETAERIRKAVEESGTDIGEPQPKKVTISLGVAIFPDDGGTAEELIERTDQALYRAKHGGRNRVERALGPNSRIEAG
ncbi:MAG: GGDEF domain-containing protein [Fibrobacteres bacterium]|nr:GGDEF domain-containing protein [Fibrobacterota bacterium]